jgi:hypothetical protein
LSEQRIAKGRINSLANICILSAEQNKQISDRRPSDYFSQIRKHHAKTFVDVIESNLIPEKAIDSLLNDDYDQFLEVRAAHIAGIIVEHI